ncbi:hypothetical protein BH11BAC3_BH11BAC3_13170 [soil metagenome]
MSMKKNNVAIILLLIVIAGCNRPCVEPRGIEGAGLNITFFNTANNEYFYPENTTLSPYSIDSLRIKDSYGNLLTTPHKINQDPANPLKRFYVVDIYPIFIPTYDQAAYETEQVKFIYIKYNFNTYDTIKLVYKARKEKCANSYEYLKAYYKNALIGETYHSYSQGLLFNLNH